MLQEQKSDRMVNIAQSPSFEATSKAQFTTSARSVISYATMIALLALSVICRV